MEFINQREFQIYSKTMSDSDNFFLESNTECDLFKQLKADYSKKDKFYMLVNKSQFDLNNQKIVLISNVNHIDLNSISLDITTKLESKNIILTLNKTIKGKTLKSIPSMYDSSFMKNQLSYSQYLTNFEQLLGITY